MLVEAPKAPASEAQVQQFHEQRNKDVNSRLAKWTSRWWKGMLIGLPGIALAVAFSPALLAVTPLFLAGVGLAAVGWGTQVVSELGIEVNLFENWRNHRKK